MQAYPIEFEFPDISEFAKGNNGIPYVYSFEGADAGPHVMICALTHGNEVCGAVVLKALLQKIHSGHFQVEKGRLTLCFSNVAAYQAFDAKNPDNSRFVDQDLNRVWRKEWLEDQTKQSAEYSRARQLQPIIDSVDLLLDIHSMHEKSFPLIVSGPLDKGIALAKDIGAPSHIIVDAGHKDGTRMRDYAGFGDPQSSQNALLVECGQHWEAGSIVVAKDITARFILHGGIVSALGELSHWLQPQEDTPHVIKVTEPVVANSMDFKFADNYTGLEHFPDKGTVIGWNDGQEVTTPYENCVLVMPSLRQLLPGVTVVRLGQLQA